MFLAVILIRFHCNKIIVIKTVMYFNAFFIFLQCQGFNDLFISDTQHLEIVIIQTSAIVAKILKKDCLNLEENHFMQVDMLMMQLGK